MNGTHESARGTPVCPLGVLQALRAAGWVVPADQQDAHELLHVLLSCIEEETTAMAKKVSLLFTIKWMNFLHEVWQGNSKHFEEKYRVLCF